MDLKYEISKYDLKPGKLYNFELGYKLRKNHFATSLELFNPDLEDLTTRMKIENQKINGIFNQQPCQILW